MITVPKSHRQTDGRTIYDRNTALCTKVHRVVKIPDFLHYTSLDELFSVFFSLNKYIFSILAAGFCPKNLAFVRKIMVLPESARAAASNRTLRTQDTSDLRHFGPKNVGQKCPDTSIPGPKCLGTLRTWVRNVSGHWVRSVPCFFRQLNFGGPSDHNYV